MDEYQALQYFMSQFGWKAYDEATVPDDALKKNGGKYITYSPATAGLNEDVLISMDLWHRSTSWDEITKKALQIRDFIGVGGISLPYAYGVVRIRRGVPFSQRMSDPDDTIRRIYINLNVEFLTYK